MNNETNNNRRQFLKNFLGSVSAITITGAGGLTGCSKREKENPYEYDLGKLKVTDPKWLTWDELSPIKLEFELPLALAADKKGVLFVTGDNTLLVMDEEGDIQNTTRLNGQAKSVTVGTTGELYLGMTDHVEVWDREGKRLAVWEALDREAIITSIAADEKNVYVADAGNKIILKYDLMGNILNKIGEKNQDKNSKGFIIPSPYFDVALGYDGALWAVNPGRHILENYSTEGDLISSWGKTSWGIHGFCGCCNPSHFTILSNGKFVTSEKGLPRIKVYKPTGELESVIAGPEHFEEETVGVDLAVNSKNQVLALDPKRKCIRIFSEKQTA